MHAAASHPLTSSPPRPLTPSPPRPSPPQVSWSVSRPTTVCVSSTACCARMARRTPSATSASCCLSPPHLLTPSPPLAPHPLTPLPLSAAGELVCEPPNNRLCKFDGVLRADGQTYAIGNECKLLPLTPSPPHSLAPSPPHPLAPLRRR